MSYNTVQQIGGFLFVGFDSSIILVSTVVKLSELESRKYGSTVQY